MSTLPADYQKQLASLRRADAALRNVAAQTTDDLLLAFRQAETQMFTRIAELLADAPNFTETELKKRLAWYFQNIPSNEIAQEQLLYGKAVTSYLDKYPTLGRLASDVIGAGTGLSKDLTTIPPELINALRARDAGFFNVLNSEALKRLDSTLLNSVIGGRTKAGALADLKGVITGSYKWGNTRGLYEWHAGTYARTGAMRFSRQVMVAKADELNLDTFVYIGPATGKIRPFCARIVGGAFTRAEIEDLDNGQTGDVFSDGGGYNCRHDWSPVSKEFFDELRKAAA